jgi:hypothetical protein
MHGARLTRGIAVLLVLAGLWALIASPAGAGKALTKQKAKKLFYTKAKADARYLEEGQVLNGSYICGAFAWQEGTDSQTFNANGPLRTGGAPFSSFTCNVPLPEGATITAVRYTVKDDSGSNEVTSMFLAAVRLVPPVVVETVASIPPTGDAATPGEVQLSTTAISKPVVDPHYRYDLGISVTGGSVGFYGATVEYTVPAAQGAAV